MYPTSPIFRQRSVPSSANAAHNRSLPDQFENLPAQENGALADAVLRRSLTFELCWSKLQTMDPAAEKLVKQYDALPQATRQEVLAELLRRAAVDPHDLPTEDDLVAAADQLFQELDRREQQR